MAGWAIRIKIKLAKKQIKWMIKCDWAYNHGNDGFASLPIC
jgi:hypothetical protein